MAELNAGTSNDAINLDPDYCVPGDNVAKHQNVFEENARSSTVKKISAIIEKEFMKEIESKKTEIKNIYKTLTKATKTMHYLRYAIVADYYNKDKCTDTSQPSKQMRPHPTVNAPKRKVPYDDMEYKCCEELGIITERKRLADEKLAESAAGSINESNKFTSDQSSGIVDKDKPGSSNEFESILPLGANSNYKTKIRIVVGNLSKWIHPDFRGKNTATHKWTVYVIDAEKRDLSSIISKVRFFLHPSYKPNDVVELTSTPFSLARFGWGEFPVRIQLHFTNRINKPVDIIHQLKLDQTFTGLQTCGAETVVEMMISTRGLVSVPNVMNLEDSPEKNCDNSFIESDLASLLKNRINDKHSNVTIHHDLPADHDYVNINPNLSQKFSDDLDTRNCTETNSSHENEKSTISKANLEQESSRENDISDQTESKNPNSQNLASNTKITKYLSKEEITEALVHLINHAKPPSLSNLLKIVASKTPMITEKALDPQYKAQHPFASESYAVYASYSKAKQSSLERQRAIRALEILSKSKYQIDLSVKEFVMWARKYGYTPIDSTIHASKSNKSVNVESESEKIEMSSTVMEEANQWIKDLENNKSSSSKLENESNEEIDVMSFVTTIASRRRATHPSGQVSHPQHVLEYPETKNGMLEHVHNVTNKRGIALPPEEVIPGVWHSTSSLLVAKAVECFVDEILRLSHSCAVDRCENDAVGIDVEDVRTALMKRDEFEILTNSGLGTDE